MKFNKAKLAALAMSVFMAVSSIPAFADGDGLPVHDHSAEPVSGYTVNQNSITWTPNEDPSTAAVEYDITNGTETYHVTGAVGEWWKGTDATCTVARHAWYRATLFGDVYSSGELIIGEALGHDMVEKDRYILVDPTCEEAGDGYKLMVCSRCGYEERVSIADELQPRGHIWGEPQVDFITVSNILTDEEGNVVTDENGLPELADPTMDGWYWEYTHRVCQRDPSHVDPDGKYEYKCIYAKKGVVAYVTDEENIADTNSLIGLQFSENNQIPPYDQIELANCTKPGYYTVTFYNAEGKPISHETYEIPAHHMPMNPQVEFKNADDASQCVVTYFADGTYQIRNISCYLPITYYEVIHCSAKGCPNKACNTKTVTYVPANGEDHLSKHQISRAEKIAQPEGDHIINTVVKAQIIELAKDEEGIDYNVLKNLEKKEDSYITISKDNATCTEKGTVTVSFKCKICKQVIETLEVPTKALGHQRLAPVGENVVEPTCTSEGYYDAVVYCKRCKEVLEKREHVRIPRLKHSNEIGVYQENGEDKSMGTDYSYDKTAAVQWFGKVVVDINGNIKKGDEGYYFGITSGGEPQDAVEEDFAVFADVYTTCEYCGGNHQHLSFAELVVDEVVPQASTCQPGKITLTATYNKNDGSSVVDTATFDYYTSINAYQGRTSHIAGAAVKENEVAATEEAAGSYDEVVRCIICGEVLNSKHVDVPAITPAEPVVEPEVLTAVTGLKATTVGMNRVEVSWDEKEGADGYIVLRGGKQIGATVKTVYVDRDADSEDWNYYWVIPYTLENGKVNKGELSNYVWAIGRVLGKVQNLKTAVNGSDVTLTWDAEPNANGYVILSKSGSNTAPFNAAINAATNSYTIKDVAAGEVQYYWVYPTFATYKGNVVVAGACSDFAWALTE